MPQVALIAIDPRTGEILAMVGGRSWPVAVTARSARAASRVGLQTLRVLAFRRAADEGLTTLTPATLVTDEPTTFDAEGTPWSPANYENEYDGQITLRRALAMSRNAATVKVAEAAGFDRVAALWARIGTGGSGTPPRAFPSIALGVFEATPYDIATAYTIFPNNGERRTLRPLLRMTRGGAEVPIKALPTKRVARADTTYLVTNMMRSVLSEGTGAAVRASGSRWTPRARQARPTICGRVVYRLHTGIADGRVGGPRPKSGAWR